jgi:hypothetical protein
MQPNTLTRQEYKGKIYVKNSVVDPYSFFTDPDPEYDVGDQYGTGSRSNTDPGL